NVAAEDRYVSTTLIQPGSEFKLGFSGSPRVADGSCCGSEEIRLWICGQLKRVDVGRSHVGRNPVAVAMIGQGLALARGRTTKHATKQVDRLLSNQGIDIDSLLHHWVPFVVGSRP